MPSGKLPEESENVERSSYEANRTWLQGMMIFEEKVAFIGILEGYGGGLNCKSRPCGLLLKSGV